MLKTPASNALGPEVLQTRSAMGQEASTPEQIEELIQNFLAGTLKGHVVRCGSEMRSGLRRGDAEVHLEPVPTYKFKGVTAVTPLYYRYDAFQVNLSARSCTIPPPCNGTNSACVIRSGSGLQTLSISCLCLSSRYRLLHL